jgi:probable HAF family extracellular repeat protein
MTKFSIVFLLVSSGIYAQSYWISNLGVLPGQTDSTAVDIDDSGHVTGYSGLRGFYYNGCSLIDIGTLGGNQTVPHGINNHQTIVGWSRNGAGLSRAFTWSGGVMEDLGGTGVLQVANAINLYGFSVGYGTPNRDILPDGEWYWGGKTFTFPSILINPPYGFAYLQYATGLNNYEQAVGYATNGTPSGAFATYAIGLVSQSGFGQLTRVIGPAGRSQFVYPQAINLNHFIVGKAGLTAISTHAFISTNLNVASIDMGTLDPSHNNWDLENSWANDINEMDQVVGASQNSPGSGTLAFISNGSGMIDLNTRAANPAGWNLAEALAINNKGQIVGWGYYNGSRRAFLLTPTSASGIISIPICSVFGGTFTIQ